MAGKGKRRGRRRVGEGAGVRHPARAPLDRAPEPVVAGEPRATTASPDPRHRAAAYALVALAVVLTWARAVPSGLLRSWDDDRFILDNADAQRVSLEGLVSFFTEPHMEAWHPLHLLSYWLDVPWVGPNGPVIHAVSLALWVLAALAVLRVMERLGLPLVAAVLATLAYALHPTQVEAVTWATGRKDILACLFACLAIAAHLRSEGPFDRASWLARLFYVLGALAKTTILPLPGLLLLIDLLHREVPWKRALLRQAPTVLLGAGLAVVVVLIWQANEMIRPDAAGGDAAGRVMLAMASVTHHLRMALLPIGNSPLYPIHRDPDFSATALVGPALLALAVVLAWRRRARAALLSLLGFLVLLLPVMNLIPMYWHWMDRYLSLPLLPLAFGFGAVVVWAGDRLASRRTVTAVAAALVLALALRTADHQVVYADDERLWRHATSVQPGSYHAWIKLGEVLRDAGRLDESVEAYERAVALEPEVRLGHTALLVAVARRDEVHLGLPERAMDLGARYIAALDDVEALRTLAGEMVTTGYRDAVLLPLGRSLDLAPVEDPQLMRAAAIQRRNGNGWLGDWYEARMQHPPVDGEVGEPAR